ncbi:MAG: glycoside hydrolase family 88 protein [Bacteroidota bacterium]
MKLKTILFLPLLFLTGFSLEEDKRTPLQIARAIADRVINDTVFELKPVLQKPQLDIQVIDFRNIPGEINDGVVYALSSIEVKENVKLKYGLSFSSPSRIWINGILVFQNSTGAKFSFKEIAYGIFEFQDTIEVELSAGLNKILVKTLSGNNKIYLREISEPEAPLKSGFISPFNNLPGKWFYIGTFAENKSNPMEEIFPPENRILSYYKWGCDYLTWQIENQKLLLELVIKDDAVYKRESFAEWMYPTGTVLFGFQHIAKLSGEKKYSEYVEQVADFTYENYTLFQKQYFEMDGFRSSNHRLFRMGMLDDASAPALPYIQLMLDKPDPKHETVIKPVLDYVFKGQSRLRDGTLCRPEPREMTIWADDLFMSVPYLLRASKLYNSQDYLNDAARQIINFNKYLFDKEKKLYKHAWFDFAKEKSVAFWGRANGWIIWATSDALINTPVNHKDFSKIKKIFKDHIDGLINYQGQSGMWHQVLDRSDSFEETSCTAMFIIGLARGIKNGWVSRSYEKNLLLAWDALKKNISHDGVVKDITRGTGIGNDLDFYFKRERFDNDPRGLGAVITAAVEMEVYLLNK